MSDPKRIAIFRLGHIGDTIIALPAFWTVRKRFPNASILYLTQHYQTGKRAQGTEVLRPGSVFDGVLSYTLGSDGVSKWQIVKTLFKLRLARIDMLVYLPPYRTEGQLNRDEKFFKLAGVKRIVGMRGYRQTDYRPMGSPLPTVKAEADILLQHLALDGISVPDDPKTLTHMGLEVVEREFARRWLSKHNIDLARAIVGVGPGSKMTAKLWPVGRYVEVVKALDAEFEPTFIVFGGGAEREVCQTVADAVKKGLNTAGDLTIRQSAAILEHCSLYLGNDTGTMHIAAASGASCVAIFSARDWPGRWYPYGVPQAIHRQVVECEGCMLETCNRGNLCLDLIKPAQVLESARKLLGERLAVRSAASSDLPGVDH